MENRINHCVECIRNLTDRKPEIGITLGVNRQGRNSFFQY